MELCLYSHTETQRGQFPDLSQTHSYHKGGVLSEPAVLKAPE